MKILIGLTTSFMDDDKSYEMCIVDVDQINGEKFESIEWEKVDIQKLAECSNIEVDQDNFRSSLQAPKEYLKADFDLLKSIGWQRGEKSFFVTDIYYDEDNHPQLYRTVNSNGYISMHDISEFEYRKFDSILGKDLEQLPKFVRKSSLEDAYEWWRKRDEAAKNSKSEFFSSAFEVYEDTPVKLLYHYLTGVKGFKEGYHTVTEMEENHSSEFLHEYMLFKDTANIKLSESIPKDNDIHILHTYGGYLGRDEDPYPNNRKLRYYGAEMSMICSKENFPEFDLYNDPTSSRSYDAEGIGITLSYRNGLISAYNQIESAGCIQENWRLGQHGDIFGMTVHTLLPEELSLLGARLQSEKEGVVYGHVSTHGQFSTLNTDSWIRSVALALSTKYYSEDLKNKITPILDSYLSYYNHGLDQLIDSLGSTDAYYTMQWTKDNSKEVLKRISKVMPDGNLEKSDIGFVDEIKELFTFARNDYDLPDWLRIYEPEVIKGLGGVDLLKDLITTRGEEESREVISSLAPGIEHELKKERRQQQRKEELQEMLDDKNQIRENNFTAIESKKQN